MMAWLLGLTWQKIIRNSITAVVRGGGGGGAGVVREAGEEGAGSGRKREKLRDIEQYFAIPKMQRVGSQQILGGNLD